MPDQIVSDSDVKNPAPWPGPTPEMLNNDPLFEAIWIAIKSWDVNVPSVYGGYCGATGNHARAVYDAIRGERGCTLKMIQNAGNDGGVSDVRWAVNVLLEKIAERFDGWETMDVWRSEAAATVRSFKHDLALPNGDR